MTNVRDQSATSAPGPRWPDRARPVLAAVGLVAVAFASGFLWWLVRHDPAEQVAAPPTSAPATTTAGERTSTTSDEPTETSITSPSTVTAGRFTFVSATPAQTTSRCESVSYGQVGQWFVSNPCKQVVRTLYETSEGSARALVSVIVVTMPDAQQATQLKGVTDTSGTGNVSDLVRDGSARIAGAPDVARGSYASNVVDDLVTIVEAAYFPGSSGSTMLLDEIAAAGLEVGAELAQAGP